MVSMHHAVLFQHHPVARLQAVAVQKAHGQLADGDLHGVCLSFFYGDVRGFI